MPNKYFVQVRQPENHQLIEIEIFVNNPEEYPGTGCISSVCCWDYDNQELKFYVRPNVNFGRQNGYTPEEARDIADWWRLAAQGVNTLGDYIYNKDDLKQKFTAKIIGKSFVLVVDKRDGTND